MIQILVMWPVVEQFSREPCFIYMAIICKEPTACCKMNSTGSDTVLKEAVLNSGQSQRLPSLAVSSFTQSCTITKVVKTACHFRDAVFPLLKLMKEENSPTIVTLVH